MKTPNIKFNLKFYDANGGEEVVRTLDDLCEKCNLSDVYDYYESGVLERWLSSIGQAELAQRLMSTKAESDLRKRINRLLQLVGVAADEQVVSDFVHIQQRRGTACEHQQVEHKDYNKNSSFMALISNLFEMGQCAAKGSCVVEELQEIEKKALPDIRRLIKQHETAFVQFLDRIFDQGKRDMSGYGRLWWVLVILYSNERLRWYVQGIYGCRIHWRDGYYRGLGVTDVGVNPICYVSADLVRTVSEEQFCEKKFGWSLDD